MASRGFLIRFIDIGLIVLFGFLMISDIDTTSRVELGSPTEMLDEVADDTVAREYLNVLVSPTGLFTVLDPEADSALSAELESPLDLYRVLQTRRDQALAAERTVAVMIAPDGRSPVQRTVDVMDVCDALGVPKSLQMEANGGPPFQGARP